MTFAKLMYGEAAEVATMLDAERYEGLETSELRAALTNALTRIDVLERRIGELELEMKLQRYKGGA